MIDKLVLIVPNLNVKAHKTQAIGDCVFCGKQGHFFINKFTNLWDCKKCLRFGNLFLLLSQLDRLDLYDNQIHIIVDNIDEVEIQSLGLRIAELPTPEDLPEINLPKFSKIIQPNDPFWKYLVKERKIHENFVFANQNSFYYNSIIRKLKGYLIMPVIEDSKIFGFVSREITNDPDKKRYRNSKTEFKYLLDGIDLVEEGDEVVLCEGRFDRIGFQNYVDLYDIVGVKPVGTFGKKLSDYQIYKLKKRGVKTVTFFWDYDAIGSMQKHGQILENHFPNVKVAFFMGDNDLGDSTPKQINKVFNARMNYLSFSTSFVEIKSLR